MKDKETCIGRTFESEYVRPDKRQLVFYFHFTLLFSVVEGSGGIQIFYKPVLPQKFFFHPVLFQLMVQV